MRAGGPVASTSAAPVAPLSDAELHAVGLSTDGESAAKTLAALDTFGGWAVGMAAKPTAGVLAFRTLSREKTAGAALKLLADRATLAGQLMALAGLFDADRAAFDAALPRYRGRTEHVDVMESGCSGPTSEVVATIVEKPDAVRLQPKETVADWSAKNPTKPIAFDIAGGGYTAVMRPR